jgi:hypothetical protein
MRRTFRPQREEKVTYSTYAGNCTMRSLILSTKCPLVSYLVYSSPLKKEAIISSGISVYS